LDEALGSQTSRARRDEDDNRRGRPQVDGDETVLDVLPHQQALRSRCRGIAEPHVEVSTRRKDVDDVDAGLTL
jgi:hypothetical protein